jgi:L-malate glycosyltransferase
MINIAYVIDSIVTPGAGTEKQLLLLIQNLNKNKFRPHLICLRNSDWLQSSDIGFPVFVLDMMSFKQMIPAIRKFKNYCKENNVKVVQTFFRDGNFFGTLAAKLSGIKVIISSRRNYGAGYWHSWFWLTLLRLFNYLTSLYISNSAINSKYVESSEKVKTSKIYVIHNGLDLSKFAGLTESYRKSSRNRFGIDDKQILIGIVANMRPVKNLQLFVDMASRIAKIHNNTRFIIIGDGEERLQLEKQIDDYQLKGRVILAGQQDDIIPFLASMDIGALCSRSESLSNSIIEYMAAGLPAVVSDVGGNPEAIGGVGGIVFKDNDLDDFSDKVNRLVTDEKLRAELGEAAKEYAFKYYDLKEVVGKHEKLYSDFCLKQYGKEN